MLAACVGSSPQQVYSPSAITLRRRATVARHSFFRRMQLVQCTYRSAARGADDNGKCRVLQNRNVRRWVAAERQRSSALGERVTPGVQTCSDQRGRLSGRMQTLPSRIRWPVTARMPLCEGDQSVRMCRTTTRPLVQGAGSLTSAFELVFARARAPLVVATRYASSTGASDQIWLPASPDACNKTTAWSQAALLLDILSFVTIHNCEQVKDPELASGVSAACLLS